MKNENFLFGCGAIDVLCYVNATEESEKEKYGKRTKEWLALFNYGTLPFYWGTYEPTEGDVRQAEMDKCVEFLTARGVTLKEGQTLRDLYEERIPMYEKYALVTINCEGKELREVAEEVSAGAAEFLE